MNKMKTFARRFIWSFLILGSHLIYTIVNTPKPYQHSLKTFIDNYIPFNSIFVIPYNAWFIYLAGSIIFLAIVNEKYYFKLLGSLLIGDVICLVTFVLYPTTIIRPEIHATGFFDQVVKAIYQNDHPYNCFPSMHVLESVIITFILCAYFKNKLASLFLILLCIAISLSTMFIKQHYFLDAVAGLLIGTASAVLCLKYDLSPKNIFDRMSYHNTAKNLEH